MHGRGQACGCGGCCRRSSSSSSSSSSSFIVVVWPNDTYINQGPVRRRQRHLRQWKEFESAEKCFVFLFESGSVCLITPKIAQPLSQPTDESTMNKRSSDAKVAAHGVARQALFGVRTIDSAVSPFGAFCLLSFVRRRRRRCCANESPTTTTTPTRPTAFVAPFDPTRLQH